MATIGYARVSTTDQDYTLQEAELRDAGCTKIYAEKKSGAKSDNRPKLQKLLQALEPGDVVIVTRLDRLARSSRDLLNIIHEITEADATFRSLTDAWCDTTTPHGKLILTILAGLSEFERSLIISRTQAGIERARAHGVAFGRKPKLNARQKKIIAERYAKGETMAAIGRDFGVSEPTIHRVLKQIEPA